MWLNAFIRVTATVLGGLLVSQLGIWAIKFFNIGNDLLAIWHTLTQGLSIELTAEQVTRQNFLANLNVVFTTGVVIVSISVALGGLALGLTLCWKKSARNHFDEPESEGSSNAVNNLAFQPNASPILYQSMQNQVSPFSCALDQSDLDCATSLERQNRYNR
ncbi:MAG: hypothetical protein RLZ35_789 [Pseudomonadota bacterium]|jgi:hypothetical protein